MSNDVKDISTQTDDVSNTGPTEQELLDAVMANSPLMAESAPPLPEEEKSELDPEESESVEDPAESEEAVSEEVEEESEETEEEVPAEDAAEEEAATQDVETFTADDLDLDAKVEVTINGEKSEVSFGDLLKGYQTEQHLSKQGRELGEARKALEAERTEKLGELTQLTDTATAMLGGAEQGLAKEYNDLESQIEKARKDGDTFEMNELKDKREQVQKQYWELRNKREGLMKEVAKQREEEANKYWKEQIDYFQKEIPNLIPDFNQNVAADIRKFAIEEGISEAILDQITDPKIVKFVDDYRRLKQNVSKGTAKRKVIPTKKAVPAKKAKPATKKAQDEAAMRKARAFKENASADDQMAFLRDFASKSLNL